jgi:hypothetical protein
MHADKVKGKSKTIYVFIAMKRAEVNGCAMLLSAFIGVHRRLKIAFNFICVYLRSSAAKNNA